MATIVKFYKDGKNVKDINSIGYLPVDEDAVKDSRHLASSGSVIAAAALGEESMMANLPIADSTLRFLFGDSDYDPTVAGVGSSGTWTKKNTKFTNVWDWTNTNTSWASAFYISGNDGCFMDYENNPVKVIAAGDTSSVTDFSRLFSWCTAITEVCQIDTSRATNVFIMFNRCINCEKFPDMDLSSATDARGIYQSCYKMKIGPNLILPTDHEYSLQNLFIYCINLETIPLYNTHNCINMMSMFSGSETDLMKLKSIPKLDTSSVTTMNQMFAFCVELTTIPELDTSNVDNMRNMFRGCTKLTSVPHFDTSNVTNMAVMFYDCPSLEEVPDFDTSKVTQMQGMFEGYNETMHLKYVPNFDYSKVTRFEEFMKNNVDLKTIPEMNIEASVTYCHEMFSNCPNIKSGQKALYDKLSAIGTITNHTDCFKDCGSDTEEGRAELAQIPTSWGGTMEEEP